MKGYLRKATCHIAMKENAKAEQAYQKALELDPNCQVCHVIISSVLLVFYLLVEEHIFCTFYYF